jgi:membrane protease YdiL (CAAX protease family)
MAPEPDSPLQAHVAERGAALTLLPIAATLDYYALPASLQQQTLAQFAPQILSYLALGLWASHNRNIVSRLGLEPAKIPDGLRWGIPTGLFLGGLNTFVILAAYPHFGVDLTFLKATPHAQLPVFIMVPWFIIAIALVVEINFRGFILGRLAALEAGYFWPDGSARWFAPLALLAGALTFAFDPFMVNTFEDLHWIAVWDGLIWGAVWLRTRNLYITVAAHAVEVIVMYLSVRTALE